MGIKCLEKIEKYLNGRIALVTPDVVEKHPADIANFMNPYKLIEIDRKVYNHYNKLKVLFESSKVSAVAKVDTIIIYQYVPGESEDISTMKKIIKDKSIFQRTPDLTVDSKLFLDKLLIQSSLPTTEGKQKPNSKNFIDSYEHVRLPIICIEPKKHFERADKNDWRFNGFLNKQNGDFYLYTSFENLSLYRTRSPESFNSRMIALDYMAGVNQCWQSTVGVILKNKEKLFKSSTDIKSSRNLLISLVNKTQTWEPSIPPEDKNTIPDDRLQFVLNPHMLFGSWSPIWELGIWERLGMMFKLNPKAEIYLCGYGTLLQAAETKTVKEEHALIKKCGVLMTAELYSELEKLRKPQNIKSL